MLRRRALFEDRQRSDSRFRALRASVCLAVSIAVIAHGQARDLRTLIRRWIASHQRHIVGELLELLTIPHVASDRAEECASI